MKKKKPLMISRLPLDKCGGKCHSIQQPPRAAACLDTAFPEFLLITAWEIFGGGICLCLLEINSSLVGRWWGCNGVALRLGTLAIARRPGSWGRRRHDSLVPGPPLLGRGCRPCRTSGSPSPCAASQCRDTATASGAASDSGKPLRHSRMGTDWDHGGHGHPERLWCPGYYRHPFAEGHTAHMGACTPGDGTAPRLDPLSLCWTRVTAGGCPCGGGSCPAEERGRGTWQLAATCPSGTVSPGDPLGGDGHCCHLGSRGTSQSQP